MSQLKKLKKLTKEEAKRKLKYNVSKFREYMGTINEAVEKL